jgi:hypothetical protein
MLTWEARVNYQRNRLNSICEMNGIKLLRSYGVLTGILAFRYFCLTSKNLLNNRRQLVVLLHSHWGYHYCYPSSLTYCSPRNKIARKSWTTLVYSHTVVKEISKVTLVLVTGRPSPAQLSRIFVSQIYQPSTSFTLLVLLPAAQNSFLHLAHWHIWTAWNITSCMLWY